MLRNGIKPISSPHTPLTGYSISHVGKGERGVLFSVLRPAWEGYAYGFWRFSCNNDKATNGPSNSKPAALAKPKFKC
jgi:hypothetical protein